VQDGASAEGYIRQNLKAPFLYAELLAAALAYDLAAEGDVDGIMELESLLFASKSPLELREAAAKIGLRFVKTASLISGSGAVFATYAARAGKGVSHSVAYGVFCASCGIEKQSAMGAYLYAQGAAMVTNCVKTVPLSQTEGQGILSRLHVLFAELLQTLETLTEDDLCRSAPGLDIASMQHERLYSRLYIS
jgi:urease accessory protein